MESKQNELSSEPNGLSFNYTQPYYKVLNKHLKHNKFQYNLGLNVDSEKFNTTGSCEPGGLYFTTKEHICKFLQHGIHIAEITIPEDAKVYQDPLKDKWKADKIFIHKITPIENMPWWRDREFCKHTVTQNGLCIQYMIQTPELCLIAVTQNPFAIKHIINQTPELCLVAVTKAPLVIRYVIDQTPELCMIAVQQDGFALVHIKIKTPELYWAAVQQCGYAIMYVKDQTPELCLAARIQNKSAVVHCKYKTYYKVLNKDLNHNGFQYNTGLNVDRVPFNPTGTCKPGGLYFTTKDIISEFLSYGVYIAEITIPEDAQIYADPHGDKWKASKIFIHKITPIEDMPWWSDPIFCMKAVTRNGLALKYVKNQTPELCMIAVQQNGNALEYVNDQTYDLCLAAINQKPSAIIFVIHQTYELCLLAVQQDGDAIVCIKNVTDELCKVALNQDGCVIRWLKKKRSQRDWCVLAITQTGLAIQFIDQTEELCLLAVKQNPCTIHYVNKLYFAVCADYLRQSPEGQRILDGMKNNHKK